MKEVIITSKFYDNLTRATNLLGNCSWFKFKFNNLEIAVGMAWEFYTSLAKRLKIKFRNFSGLIPTFVEITEEKTGR